MYRRAMFGVAAAVSAAVLAGAAAPAVADGTVIHIKNGTDKGMTFFVEFKTSNGQVRHFLQGAYLKAGQSTTFTAEAEHTIATSRKDGVTKYQIRVRGFKGRLESLKWASVEDETPDYWWGGNASSFTGLKCEDYDEDDTTHLKATLIW